MSLRENDIVGANLMQIWCRCNLAKENFLNLLRTKFGANQSLTLNFSLVFSKFSNYRGKPKFDAAGKNFFTLI